MNLRHRQGVVPLVIGVLLVAGAGIAYVVNRHMPPPVRASDAGLSGSVWVMPADAVVPFLHDRGITAMPPAIPGTAVVARAAWAPHPDLHDAAFTVMIGDARGRSGVVDAYYGPSHEDAALGNGSMWNDVLRRHDWLAGDGPLRVSGGYTSYGTFASVSSGWSGDVWVVGHLLDPSGAETGGTVRLVDDPLPVVGVALSSGDRVWWVREVARTASAMDVSASG